MAIRARFSLGSVRAVATCSTKLVFVGRLGIANRGRAESVENHQGDCNLHPELGMAEAAPGEASLQIRQ